MLSNIKLNKYANAYKEIYEILQIFPEELVNKIPKEKVEFYRVNMNQEYEYNVSKANFENIPMLKETESILANLFRDYWATETQKEKILAKERLDLNKLEEVKKQKYDQVDIFATKKVSEKTKQEVGLVDVKFKKWYIKVFNFIKNVFKSKF